LSGPTALSNGTATIEERLARWLLMANDRLDDDEIPLTHEFLSRILGVRHASVTVALHYLEQRGFIRLSRGQIVVLDRDGLETGADGTYHEPKHRTLEEAQSQAAWKLVCRGERQTLQGKSPKLNRISHTISGKLDELPTDLGTKLLGSIRINKRLMRMHYQPDRFKCLR
jgi:DNA-binding transcriptional regulator YhcF (GntR family)